MMARLPLALITLAFAAACDRGPEQLVPPTMVVGDTIPEALTQTPGDGERGAQIFADRNGGHCVLCHSIGDLDVPFQGNVGPDLTGIGTRLSEGQIRLRVVDARAVFPDTVMPSYYDITDLNQVLDTYQDKPILSAQDIEDLVAYLTGLTGGR